MFIYQHHKKLIKVQYYIKNYIEKLTQDSFFSMFRLTTVLSGAYDNVK
jgi:hypothetical protein